MKITVLKENLKKGLAVVERIVGKSLTLPILNNILIKADKTYLNLVSTNLEVGVKYWVLAKVEKEGAVSIPSKVLSSFIANIPEDKVSLDLKETTVKIDAKNYKTQIKGISAQEFPIIPDIETTEYIEIEAQPFCEAIASIISFCNQNQSRPELSGVYLNFSKDSIDFVATDSFRLAEKTISLKTPIKGDFAFILPQKTAAELVNIFSEEQKVRVYYSANQVLFESYFAETKQPKIQLNSTLIQGNYPPYKDLVPQKFSTIITLNRDEFINQLKAASLFSTKTNEVRLELNSKSKSISIFSQNPDIGENESNMEADISGKDLTVNFNYRFLLEGASAIKTKNISFELNTEEAPAVIKPMGEKNFTYLVMPVRSV